MTTINLEKEKWKTERPVTFIPLEFRMIFLWLVNSSLYAITIVVKSGLLVKLGKNSFLEKPGEIGLNALQYFLTFLNTKNWIDFLMNRSQQITLIHFVA